MLRLTKKVEYAFLALQYIAQRNGIVVTSKEIADYYGLSSDLVAKVLGSLARGGIVRPIHGVHGGYMFELEPSEINLAQVIKAVEGHHIHLVQCEEQSGQPCYIEPHCTIRSPLIALQHRIERIFEKITIADFQIDSIDSVVELELPDER